MPLDDNLPIIDDRRYDDIVAEIRTRIPRYTPEWTPVWTDLNDSDPGITLAQLFAWMSDLLIYRLGQTPEANYIKFLELVGIELRAAQPASVEITFGTKADNPLSIVAVPIRTQVSAENPTGGAPLVFETQRPLVALTAQLASVQVFDSGGYADVTELNAEAQDGFAPFGSFPQKGGAFLLGFDATRPFDRETIDLAFFGLLEGAASGFVSCATPNDVFASATIAWQYWNGKGWDSMSLLKDETLALTRTGHIVLRAPAKGLWVTGAIGEDATARYWLRGLLTKSQYEKPPQLRAVRTNTVAAIQAATVKNEVVGGSNGGRDQTFTLRQTPVLDGSLSLEVDEGDGFAAWAEVEDFYASGPQDRHYALDPTSGTIRFGDGINGAIPVANPSLPGGNVVAREYRYGGGRAGNVAAGLVKSLVRTIAGIDDSKVGNLLAAVGGRDEETLDEAKKRVPVSIKSRDRAVTAEDFETLAAQAANVARAKALPLFHPSYPNVKVPGCVTVIVVPDGDGPTPMPSEGTLRQVCAYLEPRRLVTTEVVVVGPTYREVSVDTSLIVRDDADLVAVQEAVEAALLAYFHPLTGGEDGLGWPFGGPVYYSRVVQRVLSVDGVDRVASLALSLDGETANPCADLTIGPLELASSTGHTVQGAYA